MPAPQASASFYGKKAAVAERLKYVRRHCGMCNVTSVACHLFQVGGGGC